MCCLLVEMAGEREGQRVADATWVESACAVA